MLTRFLLSHIRVRCPTANLSTGTSKYLGKSLGQQSPLRLQGASVRFQKITYGSFGGLIFFYPYIITADDEYIAFGLSGSGTEARMEGADVAILYMDTYQGYATDYNITAKSSVIFLLNSIKF